MKKFQITYQPWATSDLHATDVILSAEDEKEAKLIFERVYPMWIFVGAKEI